MFIQPVAVDFFIEVGMPDVSAAPIDDLKRQRSPVSIQLIIGVLSHQLVRFGDFLAELPGGAGCLQASLRFECLRYGD